MKSKQKSIIIFTIIPLILGLCIYLFFKVKNIFIFDLLDFNINKLHITVIPQLMNNYLTDFLWIFSFTSIMYHIWHKYLNFKNLIWIIFPLIFAILFELFQKYEIVNGTYDKYDILTYTLGNLFSIIINLKFNKYLTSRIQVTNATFSFVSK